MSSIPVLTTLDSYVAHHAAARPKALAAVHGRRRLDYAELETRVAKVAAALRRDGIRPGDRVAVLSTPRIEYLVLLNAILRAGAIYVGLNPRHVPAELAHAIDLTGPSRIFVLRSALGLDPESALEEALPLAGVSCPATPFSGPDDLPAAPQGIPAGTVPRTPEDAAVIVFTSGTTGKPKGATLHHSGLIQSAISQWEHLAVPDQRMLSNLPINHVGCILNLTYGPLVGGGALIFQEKFDPAGALDLIETEKINAWLQVPAMFQMVVAEPSFPLRDLSSLRAICAGGGALPRPVLAALRKTGARIYVEYGQTEVMSTLAFADHDSDDETLSTTIGRFDPRFEVRIADAENRPCATGEIGEVQAHGDCVMRGYWNDPAATAAAFTSDGWLRTGDLALRRADGLVEIKGRLTEMIKSGGYNLYPREIEMALETHPAIEAVVVVGLADPKFGEAAHAVLSLRPGTEVQAEALKLWCARALANYKTPRSFRRLQTLPRLPNGKIDRTHIRALAPGLPILD
ncbi:MAG: AMP-dependent synthetase and [Beijerinckiaceae bacterium]|nr:MAG: AMP-dependent synthetase and [Beijerinckiaceae bacterium]